MGESCRHCRDTRELVEHYRARASLAEARSDAKDRLLDIAAAESAALANGMLGWTKSLRRDFANQAARDRALDIMGSRIEAHLELLGKLLDATETSLGAELSLVRLDLLDVVAGAVEAERELAEERSVTVSELEGGAMVLGDRERLARAFRDLIAECIRSAEIGARIDIAFGAGAVRIGVSRQKTPLDARRVGVVAAGHALAVHGGILEKYDDYFVVLLPLFDGVGPSTRSPRKKLLVVRHEPDIAEVLAALAIARGVQVLTVQDEQLAVRAFEVHGPDVVVVGNSDCADRLRALLDGGEGRIATVGTAAEASALVRSLTACS